MVEQRNYHRILRQRHWTHPEDGRKRQRAIRPRQAGAELTDIKDTERRSSVKIVPV